MSSCQEIPFTVVYLHYQLSRVVLSQSQSTVYMCTGYLVFLYWYSLVLPSGLIKFAINADSTEKANYVCFMEQTFNKGQNCVPWSDRVKQ